MEEGFLNLKYLKIYALVFNFLYTNFSQVSRQEKRENVSSVPEVEIFIKKLGV